MTQAPKRDSRHQPVVYSTKSQHGFTLIELMVVVVILSVFAGMMTLSVGSTESRKNRAFYEHLIDSLSYVRLVSAERMQPMGLVMQADNQGQVQPVIVTLNNAYAPFEAAAQNTQSGSSTSSRNSMQLTAMSRDGAQTTPSWVVDPDLDLPQLPSNVSIDVSPLDTVASQSGANAANNMSFSFSTSQPETNQLQPWFLGTDVPQALWFGTGEAAPARIEVRHNGRLVGDAIILLPDGRLKVGE